VETLRRVVLRAKRNTRRMHHASSKRMIRRVSKPLTLNTCAVCKSNVNSREALEISEDDRHLLPNEIVWTACKVPNDPINTSLLGLSKHERPVNKETSNLHQRYNYSITQDESYRTSHHLLLREDCISTAPSEYETHSSNSESRRLPQR